MRRVVVTGMGLVSCLGNSLSEVACALRRGCGGIVAAPEFVDNGLRCAVAGIPSLDGLPGVDRKSRRFMADAALYGHHAMRAALDDAGLAATEITSPRIGLVAGSGVGSLHELSVEADQLRARGMARVPPYGAPRIMGSTVSANLATAFGITGVSYSITSACASSAHCIGHAGDLIRFGRQDIVFAGGAEEVHWTSAMPFDAMGALSTAIDPECASRPFDRGRGGFVIAGGAGMLVLESLDHALSRGARIHAELVGYGTCSDGADMVTPDPSGIARAMRLALDEAGATIDYLNAHATSTPLGDVAELNAIRAVFGDCCPAISSTKGLSGHPIGAAGVHEAIYSLLMLRDGFLAGCANVREPDPACAGLPVLFETVERRVDTVMSNSLGFGGTNVSLIFRRWSGV